MQYVIYKSLKNHYLTQVRVVGGGKGSVIRTLSYKGENNFLYSSINYEKTLTTLSKSLKNICRGVNFNSIL